MTEANNTVSTPIQNTLTRAVIINRENVTIRPIRHNDRMLEEKFIDRLSPEAKHYRFFGGINQLSQHDIGKLCDVDYLDSMAFIATLHEDDSDQKTTEVGVVRYHRDRQGDKHEMAITIADEYHHSELAEELLNQLINYGMNRGVTTLYSIELHDNQDMRSLAKRFGMIAKTDEQDSHQLIYTLAI